MNQLEDYFSAVHHDYQGAICGLFLSATTPDVRLFQTLPVSVHARHVDTQIVTKLEQLGPGSNVSIDEILNAHLLFLFADRKASGMIKEISAQRLNVGKGMPFVLDSSIDAQIACIAMNDVAQALYGEGHINIDVEDVQAFLNPHQSSGLFTGVITVHSSIDEVFQEIARVFASPVFSSNQKLGILCFCTLSPSIARKSDIYSALVSVMHRISRESYFIPTFREDWNLGNTIRITVLVSSERQWC